MAVDGQELQNNINQIQNNAFDVKRHFGLLYQIIIADEITPNSLLIHNELLDEDSLPKFLNRQYPAKDYVLTFYTHKTHSSAKSPLFPNEPGVHTSLLLCQVKGDKIIQVLNIDGFNNIPYMDILGERPGATANPYINQRLVIGVRDNGFSEAESPLQAPSWYNMNCVIYALTFAKQIITILSGYKNRIDGVFDFNKPQIQVASGSALANFKNQILEGLTGKYVRKEGNKIIRDNQLRDNYHRTIRATLAQVYEANYNASKEIIDTISISAPGVDEYKLATSLTTSKSKSVFFRQNSLPKENIQSPIPASSYLSLSEISDINHLIKKLQAEVDSCWPYPNKSRKTLKINAMLYLLEETKIHSIIDAVKTMEAKFPGVRDGVFSNRTSSLLDAVVTRYQPTAQGI